MPGFAADLALGAAVRRRLPPHEGEAARFVAAEVGETTLVLTVETFDPTQQEALLKATDALLATMTIQP